MNAQLQNNRPASPIVSFNAFMQKHKSQLELALPKHLNADRMVRLSLTAFSQNPALQKCDPKTIFASIIVASQLGLEIGVNGQGYLVPYKEKCTFVPGWKGLVDLANRGGRCTVWTGAVYEGDEFDYMLGDSPYCKHKPCGEFDESKLTHVYAIGRVKDSEMPVIEVWPIKKVHAHFKKVVVPALQPNHYSKKYFEAYAKKVALLQVLKYMPQSIELANAMDVSYAAETGKGVTIDGDFVTVENNGADDQQEQQNQVNPSNTESESITQQAENVVEEDFAPTFAQIKRGILSAKSPAHIEVMEEQAMDHADKEERKQLMQLVKAQQQKMEGNTLKKPDDVLHEPDPVVEQEEVKVVDTSRSPDLRKKYIHELNNAKTKKELAVLSRAIEAETGLTDTHRTYLHSVEQGRMEELSKQSKALDVNKSGMVKGGLLHQIDDAKTVNELEAVAKNITTNSSKMTPEHNQEVLTAYAQRKEVLSQEDMFAGVVNAELSFVDAVILRIQNAKNQDDINAEYADPAIEELSNEERQRIDAAASQRESELFGN